MEHPFGTIKRQWGFSYILSKEEINRASADTGFMFIAYNLRRISNILTINVLKEYLRMLIALFFVKIDLTWAILKLSEALDPTIPGLTVKKRLKLKLAWKRSVPENPRGFLDKLPLGVTCGLTDDWNKKNSYL